MRAVIPDYAFHHSSVPAAALEQADQAKSMADVTLVLLAGGHVRQDFVSLMNVTSPAMLPYMGRPLIYITVLNFLREGGRRVLVVLPDEEQRVEAFLRSAFGNRIALTIVRAFDGPGATPVQSLKGALREATGNRCGDAAALIAHGDIMYSIAGFEPGDHPVLFTSDYIDSDKYSSILVTEHGYVFSEAWAGTKRSSGPIEAATAHTDIGLYYVPCAEEVYRVLRGAQSPPSTVGNLLCRLYGSRLVLHDVASWIDLGHLDTSARIKSHVLGTRECNHLEIDEMRGLITKRGRNRDKLLQEINYYSRLPRELSVYFPRMLESQLGKEVAYTVEYYGYKTLSEYLVFYDVPKPVWRQVLTKILAVHKVFTSCVGPPVDPDRVFEFYWHKTERRLNQRTELAAILPLLDADEVMINDTWYPGWRPSRALIQERISELSIRCCSTIVHGDLCCGNILYDPCTTLVKFIDPRGEFIEEGCYGDSRYDIAKLLHSFHGGYDFILHEMYQLDHVDRRRYRLGLLRSQSARDAETVLFTLLTSSTPYVTRDLLLIEALLFLTMLPLHCDDGKRQTALYLRGLMLLKEALRPEAATC